MTILYNAPDLWLSDFPIPNETSHKYTRGHVVVAGGSQMTGAPKLAALGAARIGAGLVTLAIPSVRFDVYAATAPHLLIEPIENESSFVPLIDDARKNVWVIGCGFVPCKFIRNLVKQVQKAERAMILDAGALSEHLIKDLSDETPCILTPHEGEFARTFPNITMRSRTDKAYLAAQKTGAVIILKGPETIIAAPNGDVVTNPKAPAWLATAGSGDVLTGLIAGLVAQGMPLFKAACAAVWMHTQAAYEFGPGLVSTDLPDQIPVILRKLLNGSDFLL